MKTKVAKIGEKAEKSLSFVERNGKGILILGGVVFGGFLMYKAYKMVSRILEPNQGGVKITEQKVNKSLTTISDQQAENLARQLYNAMEGFGTKTEIIFDVFRKLGDNPNNFLLVYNKFGSQDYAFYGGNAGNAFLRAFQSTIPKDLVGWLDEELDSDEKQKVRGLIRKAGFAF